LRAFWLAGVLGLAIPAAQPQAAPAASNPAPSSPPPGTLNLQVHVPLVVEDVVVLDRDDRPVHGLKASDFTVTEDGKPQIPQSFEEHAAVTGQQAAAAPRPPKLGMNIFTNVTTTPANSSLNILLLDALNTPMNDQVYVRQQMLKYLKALPPGIRVAIFGLSTRLYILQGFTSDPAVLKAAVDSRRANAKASSLMDDPISGAPVEQMSDYASDAMGNDPNSATIIANMQQFEAETQTFQTTLRTQYTLAAMSQLARYLSGLPGRKNLIWFSGSFPLNILPDETLQDPFAATASYEDDVRKTTDLLARSQVAVYPVDARGLFSDPALGAPQKAPNFSRNPAVFATMNSRFMQQTAQEHGTMDKIAEDTGGKAFYNTNGLKEAVEQAVNFGSNYYTFSYTPANHKWDGRYRKITVKAIQSGWRLYYRKGYLADDPEAETRGQKVLPVTALQAAMMRGGPDPTQLLFDVRVVPDDATTDKLSEGGKPASSLMKPPYRNYLLDFLLDIHNVKLVANSEGSFQGSIEFAVLVYDAEGHPVNETVNTINANLKPDKYAQLFAHGLLFRQSIDAPAKGEYFLRIGVHDPASDRVGAVEIPISSLKSKQAVIQAQQKAQP
jgi:VWFA-related protein